jgi:hypothetical protein
VSEQRANLGRVQQSIGWAVERWCRERVLSGQRTFRGEDLEAGVAAMVRCTPGSPLRLLREAMRHGVIPGRLLSRADSLYQLHDPGAPPPPGSREARPSASERRPAPPRATQTGTYSRLRVDWQPFPGQSTCGARDAGLAARCWCGRCEM